MSVVCLYSDNSYAYHNTDAKISKTCINTSHIYRHVDTSTYQLTRYQVNLSNSSMHQINTTCPYIIISTPMNTLSLLHKYILTVQQINTITQKKNITIYINASIQQHIIK